MNKRKQIKKRIERPLVFFAVSFLLIILAIVWFTAFCADSLAEKITLAVCCFALAFVPFFLLYLLSAGKKSRGRNAFTYDFKNKRDRDISEVGDEEILDKVNRYMDIALQTEAKNAKSPIGRCIAKRYGGITEQFRPLLTIRILHIAMSDETGAALDKLFREAPKDFFDRLTENLYLIHADELAKGMQYFRAIFAENASGVIAELHGKNDYLSRCIAAYIRENISKFS